MAMGVPLDGSGAGSVGIPELVRLATEGSIRIPTIQRPFAWMRSDVLRLFDSIYRGFPIGALLFWRQDAPARKIRFGSIELDVPARPDALWVVDGQQRITSLLGALLYPGEVRDHRFNVFFDLSKAEFMNPSQGVVPPSAIPVGAAFETRHLLDWMRRHETDLSISEFDLAEHLGDVLRRYSIPTYTVVGDDQNLLREIFDRINTSGQPIKRAEVFNALFGREAGLGRSATVVQELRGTGFGRLAETQVVEIVLALRGRDIQFAGPREFENIEDAAEWYDRAEQALVRVVAFLRAEGVPHLSLMPTALPLPVLAAFLHLHPKVEPWVRRLLARWLWRGWAHGFGPVGRQVAALRDAAIAISPRRLDQPAEPSAYEAVAALLDTVPDRRPGPLPLDDFDLGAVPNRMILLALASLTPLDADGQPVDIAAQFEKHSVAAVTELVSGHRSDAAARGFWPVGHPGPTGAEDEVVLLSHAIGPVAASRLKHGDIEGFLAARADDLRVLTDDFVASRLEVGALVRPPLRDLVVADEAADE